MFDWICHFFSGWIEITVDSGCRGILADLLWQAEIPFWRERIRKNSLTVRISAAHLSLFETYAENICLCRQITGRGGDGF